MSSAKNNDYIDILEIVKSLWLHKFLLIALAVIMGLVFVVKVEMFTEDQYVASGILYVSNREKVEEDEKISQADINTAKSMSATYQEILKTKTFLQQISNELNENPDWVEKHGKISWGKIRSMTSIRSVGNTELMQISVTANDPKLAYSVANAILENAPDKLGSIFENGKITKVDEVTMPSAPIGKGTAKQGVMGAMMGFVLGCAIVVLMSLFDTKVHKSEDITARYNVSVLGEIAQ